MRPPLPPYRHDLASSIVLGKTLSSPSICNPEVTKRGAYGRGNTDLDTGDENQPVVDFERGNTFQQQACHFASTPAQAPRAQTRPNRGDSQFKEVAGKVTSRPVGITVESLLSELFSFQIGPEWISLFWGQA